MLALDRLTFSYGKTAVVRDVTLSVAPGQIMCLIGPNGAGKSTLLKCVNRILRAQSGSIRIDDRPLKTFGRKELARAVAYVPQNAGSSGALQVLDMVALGRSPHRGLSTRDHDLAVVWNAIERLNLNSVALSPFGALSGGQRQRVLIARALAQEARLILMDEPTSNLDPYYQLETALIIRKLAEQRSIGALIAIHDLSLAARLADVIVLMHEGRIAIQGGWQEVLSAEHLAASFGVNAIVGTREGIPYVITHLASPGDDSNAGTKGGRDRDDEGPKEA
jgi:iron complex transport system ATP-binding protein